MHACTDGAICGYCWCVFQEAFDDQGGDLRKELTEEQKEELTVALRRLSPDRVELVSMQIYQCIVLHLIGHSKEDFVSPDNYE